MSLLRTVSPFDSEPAVVRYRSLVFGVVGLFALSTLLLAVASKPTGPDISGPPTYLFSIPDSAEKTTRANRLVSPLSVASHGDKVAVSDSGEGKVKIYDIEGAYRRQVDLTRLAGRSKKRAYPTGVAYSADGHLYAADLTSGAIYVFAPDLDLEFSFPEESSRLARPIAICVSGLEVYVTDVGDSSVKVFSLDGAYLRTLVSPKTRKVSLAFPNGIGTGSDGLLYVSDSNNRKVLAFSSEGRELFAFDAPFGLPRGLSVDALGRVHVADTFGHRVAVFDSRGKQLFAYGSSPNEQGIRLGFPNGIGINFERGLIFVTDRADNRVQVWGWPPPLEE
ncbi:MAG: hypothetical protein C4521_11225 [Actinobacteria bacterium]|nr:MAG: hypothetical protein C4521_11225 [Actinomycetota bacterium]